MPRKHPIIVTTEELGLLVNLLKRHITVAQYNPGELPVELHDRLRNLFKIAKELEAV